VITGTEQCSYAKMHGSLATGGANCSNAPLQSRNSFFQNSSGRVGQPGIHMTRTFDVEQTNGMVDILEDIGGGLVYGGGSCTGSSIRLLTRVQAQCAELISLWDCHDLILLCVRLQSVCHFLTDAEGSMSMSNTAGQIKEFMRLPFRQLLPRLKDCRR
jgi:hypothetical protein